MDPNQKFDISAFPQTLAIFGVLVLVVLALRYIDKMFPQIRETIKAKTPWMEWAEYDEENDLVRPHNPRRWQ